MISDIHHTTIGGRQCTILGTACPRFLLVQPVDEHDEATLLLEAGLIGKASQGFLLVALKVDDWSSELTPWPMPPVFGHTPFGEGAPATLRFILQELLPGLARLDAGAAGLIPLLGGYSLAGLFALWAGYQTDLFQGLCCASPSVWYKDWIRYASRHNPLCRKVYLSLGDAEACTRNQVMARVADCLRRQYDLLSATRGVQAVLEWNPGNHFVDSGRRTAQGFVWLMRQFQL